ncbi:hypothetical protein D9M69_592810 [compost metagenome]
MAHIVTHYDQQVRQVSVGAVPFLELLGLVAGAWQLASSALVAQRQLTAGTGERAFYLAKLQTARFYSDYLLPHSSALAHGVIHGGESALEIQDDQF